MGLFHHDGEEKKEVELLCEILQTLERIELLLAPATVTSFSIKGVTMNPVAPGFSPVYTATPLPAGTVLNPAQPIPTWTSSDTVNAPITVDSTGLIATAALPATAVVGTVFTPEHLLRERRWHHGHRKPLANNRQRAADRRERVHNRTERLSAFQRIENAPRKEGVSFGAMFPAVTGCRC